MTTAENPRTGLRGLTTPRQTWRRLGGAAKFVLYTRLSIQSMPLLMVFWLLLILGAAADDAAPGWLAVLAVIGGVVLSGLALVNLELQPDLNTRPRRPVRPVFLAGVGASVLGLTGCLLLQLPSVPEAPQNFGAMLGSIIVLLFCLAYLPWLRYRWLICAGLTVATGFAFLSSIGTLVFLPLAGVIFLGTVALSLWTVKLMKEVEQSRELEGELRVAEERLRFAQELHDTLGQHLAAISLKSELALALARRDDDRLEGELEQLQQLSRISLSEMREVVQGYRAVNLATEVTGARSLLRDAEVELRVTGDALDVAAGDRELAAWFVREATTNVLRHSDASLVHLELSAAQVSMSNDGAPEQLGRLSGLAALRRRAAEHGASLLVNKDGDAFTAAIIPAAATSSVAPNNER